MTEQEMMDHTQAELASAIVERDNLKAASAIKQNNARAKSRIGADSVIKRNYQSQPVDQ